MILDHLGCASGIEHPDSRHVKLPVHKRSFDGIFSPRSVERHALAEDGEPALTSGARGSSEGPKTMAESKGSVGAAIAWMFGIWCLLFWLPLLGPFVAGLVGGKKAGSVGSAIGAVFLPSIVVAVLTFAAGAGLSGEAALGVLAGAGAFLVVVANVGPLLVGAIIGGLFA